MYKQSLISVALACVCVCVSMRACVAYVSHQQKMVYSDVGEQGEEVQRNKKKAAAKKYEKCSHFVPHKATVS